VTGSAGLTLIELMLTLAIGATVTGIAIPLANDAIDEIRTASAARYIATRIGSVRLDAVRHSQATALRFEVADGGEYRFTPMADGNGNGVRSTEIRDGTDQAVGPPERLCEKFAGVSFGLMAEAPDADGQWGTGEEGVRIGSARILTMSSDGTATSGTLYIRGRRSQYAVRILGVTGRTRVLHYQPQTRTWISR
jgi:prepilin-type N-terminal cleavage/methylation domain-containing protein